MKEIRERIEPIYRNRLHPHYTDHSIVHVDRVAELAENLVAPLSRNRKLNDDEATVLYGGCYFLDIGMHNEKAGEQGRLKARLKQQGRTWERVRPEERLNIIRESHHEISADMVQKSSGSGRSPTGARLTAQDHPREIAAICEAHCLDAKSRRYLALMRKYDKPGMRIRLISAILRLADILDEAQHRAIVQQRESLDLNIESRMHWWRHYYTRYVEVERDSNRVTISFDFPSGKRDEYERLIPPLQMPSIEREFASHRAVLAANGLSWYAGLRVADSSPTIMDVMPPEVESRMLLELANRQHLAERSSRVKLLKYFRELRSQLLARLSELQKKVGSIIAAQYLEETLRVTMELWSLGSRLTARYHLSSALFDATHNGRSVPAELEVHAAVELVRMQSNDRESRDPVNTLFTAMEAAKKLEDDLPEKVEYFKLLASLALRAGYFQDGKSTAREAIRLLLPGLDRDEIEAELVEAALLHGQKDVVAFSRGTPSRPDFPSNANLMRHVAPWVRGKIPHVATDAPGCDFKNALSIVRNVATRFPDLKSEIKGRLLDGKDRIPHLLLAMAPEFDASFAYKNPDGLATVASEHLRLQVERISDPETWTRGLGEVMVWQHNDPSGRVAVKIGSSAQELESVVAYRANISRPALAGLIDTIVKTICDPQNANTNRQMLFHFLGRLADSFSEETARLVLEIAVQYAVDHRAADHPLYGQDEAHSPLQSNRMNSGWPQDVRGEALIALAETTRRLPTIELARAKECIRRAMLDAHPTTRQMAYFAVGKLGDSASDLLPMVASGTRDADQDAAMMVLYVVGLLATDAIDPRRCPRS